MRKLKLNDSKRIINEIQVYFKKIPEGDFLLRLNAILLIALGSDCSRVAKIFKKSIRAIHSWVNTVNNHSINALKTTKRTGF